MTSQTTPKLPTSIRLSEEALCLRAKLAAHHGISLAAVVEAAIRQMARTDGIQTQTPETIT